METDGSGVGSVVANEAQATFLALEALLAVVFSVATLTDEALDSTEVNFSPLRYALLDSITI
jgi:hypothetical protein